MCRSASRDTSYGSKGVGRRGSLQLGPQPVHLQRRGAAPHAQRRRQAAAADRGEPEVAHRLATEIRERIRFGSFSLAEYFPADVDVGQPLTVDAQRDDWLAAQRLEVSTSAGDASAIRFWRAAVCDRRGARRGDRPVRMLKHSDVLTALASRLTLSVKTVNHARCAFLPRSTLRRPWLEERALRRSHGEPTLRRLGMRYRPPYNTRHTYATMMLMAGMTPALCAKQLGHSVEMFLRTYAKWIDGGQNALEMGRLEAALAPEPKPPRPGRSGDGGRRLPAPYAQGSRRAWLTVASIRHKVIGLTGDAMKPRER